MQVFFIYFIKNYYLIMFTVPSIAELKSELKAGHDADIAIDCLGGSFIGTLSFFISYF